MISVIDRFARERFVVISMKTFSIIVPVYYNELNLPDTVPQLLELKSSLASYELELIFVDDGSKDQSLALLLEYQRPVWTITRYDFICRGDLLCIDDPRHIYIEKKATGCGKAI